MASSNIIAFFLLSVLISSPLLLQIHARDSQFFSKVTTKPTETVVLPDKEKEQQSLVNKQETEQPEFIPQNQNGYGLYGHETGLFPPATETETKTESGGSYGPEKYYNNDKDEAITKEAFSDNNGETQKDDEDLLNFDNAFDSVKDKNGETFYNNNHAGTERYGTESQTQKDNVGETFYSNNFAQTEKNNVGGETYYNTDRNTDRFGSQLGQTETKTYYNDNRFDNGFTNELNARYNTYRTPSQNQDRVAERKGMSDTRFLENGRYYYDLNKEQNQYASQNTYNPNSNYNYKTNYDSNEFGTRAYQSNKNYADNFYDNSGADKYEFNTMEEYENSRLNRYDP